MYTNLEHTNRTKPSSSMRNVRISKCLPSTPAVHVQTFRINNPTH